MFTAELMYGEYLEYMWSTGLSDWILTEGVQIINEYENNCFTYMGLVKINSDLYNKCHVGCL